MSLPAAMDTLWRNAMGDISPRFLQSEGQTEAVAIIHEHLTGDAATHLVAQESEAVIRNIEDQACRFYLIFELLQMRILDEVLLSQTCE